VHLKAAIDTYGHTAPLKDGTVGVDGLEFEFVDVQPIIAAFRRMVRALEFDMCEMAITTYMTALAYGKPLIALPIFVHRLFNHSALTCNTRSGVTRPAHLAGRRAGVRAYTVTQGVWSRGLLDAEYGVDPDSVTWVLVDEEHVQEFNYPPNVERRLGQNLGALLRDREIDAAIGAGALDAPYIQPLIPDAAAAEEAWSRRVGFSPINHLIVLHRRVYDTDPWLAQALFDAFTTAKTQSLDRLAREGASSASDEHVMRLASIAGGDPLPYGIDANRAALETIIDYAYRPHVLPRRYTPEELFAPVETGRMK
jgi:4,5-dihydroxyphthalate decarboxylase